MQLQNECVCVRVCVRAWGVKTCFQDFGQNKANLSANKTNTNNITHDNSNNNKNTADMWRY